MLLTSCEYTHLVQEVFGTRGLCVGRLPTGGFVRCAASAINRYPNKHMAHDVLLMLFESLLNSFSHGTD